MQGQKRYVNGYVVIIFGHYINRRGGGGMGKNVTWASFFGVAGRGSQRTDSLQNPVGAGLPAMAVSQLILLQRKHRYRRQASSHISPAHILDWGCC